MNKYGLTYLMCIRKTWAAKGEGVDDGMKLVVKSWLCRTQLRVLEF